MNKNSNAPTAPATPGRGRPKKNEPGLVRVNVQVPVESHKKLKIYCAQNGTTITDLVRKLIDDLPA